MSWSCKIEQHTRARDPSDFIFFLHCLAAVARQCYWLNWHNHNYFLSFSHPSFSDIGLRKLSIVDDGDIHMCASFMFDCWELHGHIPNASKIYIQSVKWWRYIRLLGVAPATQTKKKKNGEIEKKAYQHTCTDMEKNQKDNCLKKNSKIAEQKALEKQDAVLDLERKCARWRHESYACREGRHDGHQHHHRCSSHLINHVSKVNFSEFLSASLPMFFIKCTCSTKQSARVQAKKSHHVRFLRTNRTWIW